ncbi:MAG: hypothetical protein ACLTK8_00960 [Paeniclostridium sp.]
MRVDIYQFEIHYIECVMVKKNITNKLKEQKYDRIKNAIVNGSFPSRKKYYPHIPRKLIEITENALT